MRGACCSIFRIQRLSDQWIDDGLLLALRLRCASRSELIDIADTWASAAVAGGFDFC